MSKHIIVTGASRGIGFETALSLAKDNHTVTAIARSRDKLKELSENFPVNIHPITLDITNDDAPGRLSKHLTENDLDVDAVIHNAGSLVNKPFSETEKRDWQNMMNIHVIAPALLTKAILSRMSDDSHILHIGSMGGVQGSSKFQGLSAYSVAKGALTILTECLTAELASKNISCNCLALGAVYTEMLQEAFPGFKPPVTAQQMGRYIANFAITGHQLYNGKVLQVALADPE